MVHDEGFFIGSGGTELFWRSWTPTTPVTAEVVLVHGLAEHSGRYDELAQRFNQEGFRVFALDHRGHGRSAGRRVHVAEFETFVADLETFRLQVVLPNTSDDDRPSFLVGHSMGGAIALAHTLRDGDAFSGLVLSAPAIVKADVPKPLELTGRVISRLAPTRGLVALDSSEVSRDPVVVTAYDNDPHVHRGKLTARLAAELVNRGASFVDEVHDLALPVLQVHGTADTLVNCEAASAVFEKMGSADKTLRVFDGLYHEVFNEPERSEVMQVVVDWMNARR